MKLLNPKMVFQKYIFLDEWFITKCLWASKSSLKKTLASLKKFYQYMSENNYVDATEYQNTFSFLKDNMDEILESIDAFADFDEDDLYSIF